MRTIRGMQLLEKERAAIAEEILQLSQQEDARDAEKLNTRPFTSRRTQTLFGVTCHAVVAANALTGHVELRMPRDDARTWDSWHIDEISTVKHGAITVELNAIEVGD